MSDSDLIDALGGPARVASQLGWSGPGVVQRISNWKRRGIPFRVKLEHQMLFCEQAPPAHAPIGVEGAPAVPLAEEARDAA